MTGPVRRDQLVRTASDLFVSRGYANCSVADIVEAVGLAHGTFYNYFDGKREVFDAVIDRGLELIRERIVEDRLREARTLDEFFDVFRAVADRLHALVEHESALVRFVVFEAPAVAPAVMDRLLALLAQFGELAADAFAEVVRSGDLRAGLDFAVAGEAMAATLLLAATGSLDEDGRSGHDLTQPLVDFLRSGIAAVPVGHI